MYRFCRVLVISIAIVQVGHSALSQEFLPRSSHAGLLGKAYVQGNYLNLPIQRPGPIGDAFTDSAMDGFDITANVPIPWLTSEMVGTDFYAEYSQLNWSMHYVNRVDLALEDTSLGVRVIGLPEAPVRPFIGLGALMRRGTIDVQGIQKSRAHDSAAELRLGIEADFHSRLSARAEVRLPDSKPLEADLSRFDGALTFWINDHLFTQGGVIVPFGDWINTGGFLGGGIAY